MLGAALFSLVCGLSTFRVPQFPDNSWPSLLFSRVNCSRITGRAISCAGFILYSIFWFPNLDLFHVNKRLMPNTYGETEKTEGIIGVMVTSFERVGLGSINVS